MADSNKLSGPPSPTNARRHSRRNLAASQGSLSELDERTPLIPRSRSRIQLSTPQEGSKPVALLRNHSYTGTSAHHSRNPSWSSRILYALSDRADHGMSDSRPSIHPDDRVWYDQFTSTDWVHDSIADAHRQKAIRSRKDFRGRLYAFYDASQGWILSAVCGFIVALIAYTINVSEVTVFDYKDGYCARAWYLSEKRCCPEKVCEDWRAWSEVFESRFLSGGTIEYLIYFLGVIVFACVSCFMTLTTKTVVPSAYKMTTFDENLAAEPQIVTSDESGSDEAAGTLHQSEDTVAPPMVYYSAAGSGVAEVKVILSGFVLHGFLGLKTLLVKSIALALSVASGLSLGKEGPYVHIATCVGNIACRLFTKYDQNDAKRREVLSATAAAGVAVAFGAPLGGVLFGLEEVSYFFPAKTLFRTFFCCIVAALTLKFLDPYGTQKIVMFQVRYVIDWEYFELVAFIGVGILGGAAGAMFIKASKHWAQTFRRLKVIKRYPQVEVLLVAILTALIGYWNVFTKLPVARLLLNLASPCDDHHYLEDDLGLCPESIDDIPPILSSLLFAFLIKGLLTIVTFGIKVPAGIYVPSMVVGGLMGRLVGHMVQWLVLRFPHFEVWKACAASGNSTCIQPGVYGLIAAGATMCGVTRLSVTLAVILFELTGSLDYVLPFSLAILVAKWTADALEPDSIYDLLTNMNSYPFLDNKHKPVFTSDLADIIPRTRRERVIDITNSPLVAASSLRPKLDSLHRAGELDGGLPIIRHNVLVGLIPAPDLEYALDNLNDEANSMCLMTQVPSNKDSDDESDDEFVDPTDFTPFIDPAPIALDIKSPMDLVYECFVKLGLRYVCVLRDGTYAGMVHKKRFVQYIRELEQEEKRKGKGKGVSV